MKKRLKKKQRGKIATILFVVVALLFAAAILVVSNLKNSGTAPLPEPATGHSYLHNQNNAPLQSENPFALAREAEMLKLVSYPAMFSFYYA